MYLDWTEAELGLVNIYYMCNLIQFTYFLSSTVTSPTVGKEGEIPLLTKTRRNGEIVFRFFDPSNTLLTPLGADIENGWMVVCSNPRDWTGLQLDWDLSKYMCNLIQFIYFLSANC